jgi:hypothetical protein
MGPVSPRLQRACAAPPPPPHHHHTHTQARTRARARQGAISQRLFFVNSALAFQLHTSKFSRDRRRLTPPPPPPQLLYDGVPQPLNIVAIDGVPVGTPPVGAARPTRVALPTARRAEIIVRGPDASVLDARLVTLAVDTGPVGDSDPARPLVRIVPRDNATLPVWRMPIPALPAGPLGLPAPRAARLWRSAVNASRRLFFSQDAEDPGNPLRPVGVWMETDCETLIR